MKKVAGKFGQTEKCVYFCTRISDLGQMLSFFKDRDLAQLVAHTSGGREVAGSSPVIPTKTKTKLLKSSLVFCFLDVLIITYCFLGWCKCRLIYRTIYCLYV